MSILSVCPCCDSAGYAPFYTAKNIPAQSSVVFKSAAEASGVPTGDVVLALCAECGFIGNAAFDDRLHGPQGDCEEQQGFSPTFSSYATGLAERLVARYDLRGKRVLEIGCGKGDFLSLLCEMGENEGIGIDPMARAERVPAGARSRVTIVPEVYSDEHAGYRPDFVVCRHTLEHIGEPLRFLETLRRTLGGLGTPVVFEVPDATRILEEGAFWDVYYEHCAYFTPASLAAVFRRAGFDVTDVHHEYGGQYLLLHATPGRGEASAGVEETTHGVEELSRRFASSAGAAIALWSERIHAWQGRAPVLWGSGSKSVAFIATLDIADRIGGVVDVNPFRHGRYAPGFDRSIMAPSELAAAGPDFIIVMNPVYTNEIAEMVAGMGIDARIIAV